MLGILGTAVNQYTDLGIKTEHEQYEIIGEIQPFITMSDNGNPVPVIQVDGTVRVLIHEVLFCNYGENCPKEKQQIILDVNDDRIKAAQPGERIVFRCYPAINGCELVDGRVIPIPAEADGTKG